MRRRWDITPQTPTGIAGWAQRVAGQAATGDPRVVTATTAAEAARETQRQVAERHSRERAGLRRQLLGDRAAGNLAAQVERWQERVATARRDLDTIEALPVAEAAQLIRVLAGQDRAQREAAEALALAERQARAARLHDLTIDHHDPPRRDGPSLGL